MYKIQNTQGHVTCHHVMSSALSNGNESHSPESTTRVDYGSVTFVFIV